MDMQVHPQDLFIIGLTGNIGTGKSTVLNMLRHLGAYGIDADELTRKVYDQRSAQQEIIGKFGRQIIDGSGHIDRARIAGIVFNDTQALQDLEDIIHPYVTSACVHLIHSSMLPIIVIEAIKLLESDLADLCDSIWVVNAETDTITRRLVKQRGMPIDQVRKRLSNQSPAHEKIKFADVVIHNEDDLRSTWEQVSTQWRSFAENKKQFGKLHSQTKDIFSKSSTKILHPFSAGLSTIMNLNQFSLIPSRKKLDAAKLQQIAACFMILFMQDSYFSVWKLSTFDLKCTGLLTSQLNLNKSHIQIPIGEIKFITDHYQIANVIIPVHSSLKEEGDRMRENGYQIVDRDADEYPQWIKAGYNLFSKQLWDTAAIFNIEKSLLK